MFFAWSTLCTLNSEVFPILNVALVSYRDLNLQNANKMMSLQHFAIISTSIYNRLKNNQFEKY